MHSPATKKGTTVNIMRVLTYTMIPGKCLIIVGRVKRKKKSKCTM